MAGLNKITLIGIAGKDPETRLSNGLQITSFSLAVNEKVKGQDKTEWFKVIAFGKLAEICSQYVAKGKQVYVEGRLQVSEWEGKDGAKRFTLEVVANQIVLLGDYTPAQQQRQNQPQPKQTEAKKEPEQQGFSADIPF